MRDKFLELDELLTALDEATFLHKATLIKPTIFVTREILVAMALRIEDLEKKLQRYEEKEHA